MTKITISAEELAKNRDEFKDIVGGGAYRVPPVREVLQQIDIEKKLGEADKFRQGLDLRRDKRTSRHNNISEEEKFHREHPYLYEVNRPVRVRASGLFSLVLICALAFIVFRFAGTGDSQYLLAGGVIFLLFVWFRG